MFGSIAVASSLICTGYVSSFKMYILNTIRRKMLSYPITSQTAVKTSSNSQMYEGELQATVSGSEQEWITSTSESAAESADVFWSYLQKYRWMEWIISWLPTQLIHPSLVLGLSPRPNRNKMERESLVLIHRLSPPFLFYIGAMGEPGNEARFTPCELWNTCGVKQSVFFVSVPLLLHRTIVL